MILEILPMLATIIATTKFHVATGAALGGGLGIGLLGMKAAEATGRNPGAATPVLVISIILAALIEGIFILSAFAV
ncbi:MAG: ATPase [Akkermansiaceae bacterium]